MATARSELPRGPAPRRTTVTLLVNLPPRHRQFFGNLRAALGPSRQRLPLELSLHRIPRGRLADSALLHACALGVMFILPHMRLAVPVVLEQKLTESSVIYYPAQYLPETHDSGGSARGSQGPAGGRASFHSPQKIHVARAVPLNNIVADGPRIPLPSIPGAAANLLALPSPPAAMPVLESPVELERRTSKIARPDRSRTDDTGPASSALQIKLQRNRASLPPSMVALTPTANVTLASPIILPRPRPVLPKEVATETAGSAPVPLHTVPLRPVPEVAEAEANSNGSASAEVHPEVVISARPGEVIGVPTEGKAGSLAVTPKGNTQPGIGSEGRGLSVARGPGTGSSLSGGWTGAGEAGSGPGSNPVAKGGVSPDSGRSGAGRGSASTTPGVDIRGGVVALGSFGPTAVPEHSPSASTPARKPPAITIIATSRSGGGLPAYGAFKNRTVYTVYVDTTAGEAVLQFAAQESTAVESAGLTPPDPLSTQVPRGMAGGGVVFACVLDESGHLQNLRVVRGASPTPALEEALRRWIFHPALNGGQAVAVDALIGIGVGVQ